MIRAAMRRKEEVFLRKGYFPDILCGELIEASQNEESQKAHPMIIAKRWVLCCAFWRP